MMNDLSRDTNVEYGKLFLHDKWLLNVYLIRSNPNEEITSSVITQLLNKHLQLLEKNNMSEEFDYYRTGFAFLHFGNRGVDLTIWHIGRWGTTFETFICSWYCYNRDIWNMEQLNAAEPMLCQYERKLLNYEISNISSLISCDSISEIRRQYLRLSTTGKSFALLTV